MMKSSWKCLSASQSGFQSLVQALQYCGIEQRDLPQHASDISNTGRFCILKPLLTNNFDFFNHQLTLRGDVLVDDYLSRHLMKDGIRRGAAVSVHSARLLQSVFHNHFTLRLLAKRLNFESIATPFSVELGAKEDELAKAFVEVSPLDVQPRDMAGTSFHIVPLAGSQSPLGWKLSHFIGCLDQLYGTQRTLEALDSVYGLSSAGSLSHQAERLLLECVQHFPVMNIAEALLAAQEMPVRFATRTREIPPTVETAPGSSSGPSPSSPGSAVQERVALSGFGTFSGSGGDIFPKASTSGEASHSLHDRVHDLAKTKEWITHESAIDNVKYESERFPYQSSDGWLDLSEQQRARSGPAHANSTEFLFKQTFADSIAISPASGKVISKKKFKVPVRDPRFYDKQSDLRNGLPLDSGGRALGVYLEDALKQRHVFEVSMFVGKGAGKLAGKAVSTRYTLARESAARAYLGTVLQDLALLQ